MLSAGLFGGVAFGVISASDMLEDDLCLCETSVKLFKDRCL